MIILYIGGILPAHAHTHTHTGVTYSTHIEYGSLQGSWVVIDVVGAKREHAHEEEEEESM